MPLALGLSVFSRERAGRIARALELADDLNRERERVIASQRRIGETAAANLDRGALERIIVATAVELIQAEAGGLTPRPPARQPRAPPARRGPPGRPRR